MKNKFEERIGELLKVKKENGFILMKVEYSTLINDVKKMKAEDYKKQPQDYQFLRRYDVAEFGVEKLIVPTKENYTCFKLYAHTEELFIILHDAHYSISHGGRNRMKDFLNEKYKNIIEEIIILYLNLCEICQKKHNVRRKGLVVKPIISKELNSRCQVDLIDMQSQPDGAYKFILVYRDHLTKSVQLRPLTAKTAVNVAYELMDLFFNIWSSSAAAY